MKTVDRIAGPARLTTYGEVLEVFVMSADPIGLWLDDDTLIPWTAVERVELSR